MNLALKIRQNSIKYANKKALIYINRNNQNNISLSFGELDARASTLANHLVKLKLTHKNVILLYPAGIDFIIAYLACLYANVYPIAVIHLDTNSSNRVIDTINYIINDSNSKAILTDAVTSKLLTNHVRVNVGECTIVNSNELNDSTEFPINNNVNLDSIACIQYSSGTTSEPKGVVISHKNLIESLSMNSIFWRLNENDVSLSRSPHYYIYGLMTGLLLPLYNANTNYILSTADVTHDPLFWLETISKYQVTYSGCPNFGYQQCVDKINEVDLTTLNFSHWRLAICGGESIQIKTFNDFTYKLKNFGFKAENFCSSYGMTEMTGFVSATKLIANYYRLNRHQLRQRKVVKSTDSDNQIVLISSGTIGDHVKIKIINPDTMNEVAADEIGEICLAGLTLCNQYLNPLHTMNKIMLQEEPGCSTQYFRTGDEGFIDNEELYITSRRKELIILNGEYYIPGEIEGRVKLAHPILSQHATIAVCKNTSNGSELIVFQEIPEGFSQNEKNNLEDSMHHILFRETGLNIHHIHFVVVGTLPRTHSGKLQRHAVMQPQLL